MTAPQITTFPTPPDSTQGRAIFVAQANQFGDDLLPYGQEMNAIGNFVNQAALDVEQDRIDAQQAAANAISASQGVAPPWSSGTHAAGALVWSAGGLYRTDAGVTSSTPPENDPSNWELILVAATALSDYFTAGQAATLQTQVDNLVDVPVNAKSAAYTLALSDRGKDIYTNSTVTIPTNANVAFPVGTVIMITSSIAGDITINPASGVTLRWEGDGATGQRTLENYGSARIHKKATNTWCIGGAGLK